MAEDGNGKLLGKRKVAVALVFIGWSIGIGAALVTFGKITGSEFVSTVDAAKYVALTYLGVNLAKEAVQKLRSKE